MGSTKIINVLKNDRFEEILDIAKRAEASEVIFVLPKKTKAFESEEQFSALNERIKGSGKSVAFLCSNPEVNELAKKYNFDVLSSKTENSKPGLRKRTQQARPAAVTASFKNDDPDTDYEDEEENDEKTDDLDEEIEEEEVLKEEPKEPAEDAEDYKEEESEEITEDDPPFGTKTDDEGNIVYDDEEENMAEEISFSNDNDGFQVITAGAKSRGMEDVIRSKFGKNVRVTQKDKRPLKLETKTGQSGLDWGNEQSENIWSSITRPGMPRSSFLNKFKLFKKRSSKNGLLKFNYKGPQKRWIGILSLVSVLILAFIIFLTTGSAKIEIMPRAEKLNLQLKISISPDFSSVNNSFNRIPGQIFTINKSAVDEFSATAEKDAVQKSRGIITVYNEYSTSPQPLIATTRFEFIQTEKTASEEQEPGLIFRTLKAITVPGMKVENGVVTPGKIDIEVIADKAGQTYNIPAGDFGIIAWRERKDTARYEKIYGKSSGPMHGGIFGKAKVVSEFDYNNAKDLLTAKVKKEINESLKSQSAGLELLTNIEPAIDSLKSTAEIDDAADTFTMTVESSMVTIGYKKDDLMALITQYVDKTNDLMVVPEKLGLSYKDAIINPTGSVLEVTVNISGNAYAKIDREDIASNLMGKNEIQIKDYLGSKKDIDSAKVILSPFWVNKIPKNREKINISLTF